MTEYTPEQITDMANFLTAHPEMIPDALKAKPADTTTTAPHAPTVEVPGTEIGKNIASTVEQQEIQRLKEQLDTQMKASTYATTLAIQSAIQEREAELQEKTRAENEWNKAVSDLYSCMAKSTADKLLKDKPPINFLRSVIEVVKGSGAARVGVSAGIEMRSTVNFRDRMQAINIPSVEFNSGRD